MKGVARHYHRHRHHYTKTNQSHQPPRLSSLLHTTSTFLLNLGLALAILSWKGSSLRFIDLDLADWSENAASSGDDFITLTANAVAQLAWLQAAISAVGTVGVYIKHPNLIRLFARFSTLDLSLTLFVLLTTLLLTFTPSLSLPFSELICREITRGETILSTSERRETGAEMVGWGVETCEESWVVCAVGFSVILVCLVVVKSWGIWSVWEYLVSLESKEEGLWCDVDVEKGVTIEGDREKKRSRRPSLPTTSSTSRPYPSPRPTRARSLPTPPRPQLVLVPVFYDGPQPGLHTLSPSSYSPLPLIEQEGAFTSASDPSPSTTATRQHNRRPSTSSSEPPSSPTPRRSRSSSRSRRYSPPVELRTEELLNL